MMVFFRALLDGRLYDGLAYVEDMEVMGDAVWFKNKDYKRGVIVLAKDFSVYGYKNK